MSTKENNTTQKTEQVNQKTNPNIKSGPFFRKPDFKKPEDKQTFIKPNISSLKPEIKNINKSSNTVSTPKDTITAKNQQTIKQNKGKQANIRLILLSYESSVLERVIAKLKGLAQKHLIKIISVALPIKTKLFNTPKSPFIYTASKDQWILRRHKRIIIFKLRAGQTMAPFEKEIIIPPAVKCYFLSR